MPQLSLLFLRWMVETSLNERTAMESVFPYIFGGSLWIHRVFPFISCFHSASLDFIFQFYVECCADHYGYLVFFLFIGFDYHNFFSSIFSFNVVLISI